MTHDDHFTEDHFIEVFRKKTRLGSGMRLTRYFALTAAHCLGPRELAGEASVRLLLPGGQRAVGEVQDYDRLSDLALLRLKFSKDESIPLPGVCFDSVQWGEPWRATRRPSGTHETLNGHVVEVSDGVLLLDCRWFPDDYGEFAGSPVEREGSCRPQAVLGLIVERRAGADGATAGRITACTAREAVRCFDRFKFRTEDWTGDRAEGVDIAGPQAYVSPYTVAAIATERDIRVRAAVDEALDRAGYTSVVRVHWTRR
ncbi:hypothetical protein AB0N81_38915 [Streptomyces sp. NPDC093510]|uniref:hypothetical protein n=1 Tax=Streptomyces sp. NPDC093510 TaxID=3155199 RepID=UPI003434C9CA